MTLHGVVVVDDVDARGNSDSLAGPVALEHVANRPILHHVIDALRDAGVEKLVVACSTEHAPEIADSLGQSEPPGGSQVRYVVRSAPLHLRDALTLAAPIVGAERCVVHVANGLLDEQIAPFIDQLSHAPDLMLMVHQSPLAGERLSIATQRMLHLAELDPARAGLGVAGAWLFGPGALQLVHGAELRAAAEVDLTSVGKRLREAGGSIDVQLVTAWRRFDGDAEDLLELNRIALDRLGTDPRRPQTDGNRIEGRVQVDPSALVRSSVIIGPTVIGPDARIVDSYIGPYTAIGTRARVEGAEIERSIIAAGASVMHVAGRLEGSVVGRDSRIFRDFSLPRALRVRGGDRTEVTFF
jgi:glucose-1-phosphate thymidylyltransferase